MDEDAPGGSAGDAARRADLQRLAYGRGSSDADRTRARDELDALESADREIIRAAAARRPPDRDENGAAGVLTERTGRAVGPGSGAADDLFDPELDHPDDDLPPFGRRRRIIVSVVAVIVAVALALAAIGVGRVLIAGPDDTYERSQVASDRDVPEWLTNAFLVAEQRTGDDGLAARLTDSVRRVEGGGLVGYLFRDESTDTYCIAGSRGFDCAGPGVYELNGLLVTMIDPRNPTEHALRYEMRADSGFRARVLDLDRPAELKQMDPARWPRIMSQCLQGRGFAVAADPSGDLFAAPVSDDAQLELAMAIVHCTGRFPLMGEYLTITP
ncbi:MAG: hypothetical protein ABWZ77_04485 [Naasia sp.]